MNKSEFMKIANKARLANKDKWVVLVEDGIEYKAFNTWVQIYRVDGFKYVGPTDCKVSEFKEFLVNPS